MDPEVKKQLLLCATVLNMTGQYKSIWLWTFILFNVKFQQIREENFTCKANLVTLYENLNCDNSVVKPLCCL